MKGIRNRPQNLSSNYIIVDKESIEVLERNNIDLYSYFKTYFQYLEEKHRRRY